MRVWSSADHTVSIGRRFGVKVISSFRVELIF